MDEIFIQHRFTITADDGSQFTDAIVLPQADYEALSEKEIDNIKQQRFDNWVTFKSTPPPEPDPQEQLDRIAAEKQYAEELVAQKSDELEAATAAVEAGTVEVTPEVK